MIVLDLVVVGHFAMDQVERDGKVLPPSLGGTVTFSSLAAAKLGAKVGIVSKVGPDFKDDYLLVFARSGIDISGVRKVSAPTTKYRLQYVGEERRLTLLSKCDPITPSDLSQFHGKINAVHLGPIAGEISLEIVKMVAEWGTVILLDLQGVVRRFKKNGSVLVGSNRSLSDIVKNVTILKAALREGETVTNASGPEEVASSFLEMGCKISIVTLGGKGSYVSTWDGQSLFVPAIKPRRVTDFTGAGDVYAGSFVIEYMKTKNVRRSALIASSAVSFKVEGHSTSGFASREEIEERAKPYIES